MSLLNDWEVFFKANIYIHYQSARLIVCYEAEPQIELETWSILIFDPTWPKDKDRVSYFRLLQTPVETYEPCSVVAANISERKDFWRKVCNPELRLDCASLCHRIFRFFPNQFTFWVFCFGSFFLLFAFCFLLFKIGPKI